MRRTHVISLIVVLLVSAGSLTGVILARWTPVLGVQLQGGVEVVLRPTSEVADEQLDRAIEIIRSRVDAIGVAEPDITRQGMQVVIQLPGVKDKQRAVDLIGQTAELRFRPVSHTFLLSDTDSFAAEVKNAEQFNAIGDFLSGQGGPPDSTTGDDAAEGDDAGEGDADDVSGEDGGAAEGDDAGEGDAGAEDEGVDSADDADDVSGEGDAADGGGEGGESVDSDGAAGDVSGDADDGESDAGDVSGEGDAAEGEGEGGESVDSDGEGDAGAEDESVDSDGAAGDVSGDADDGESDDDDVSGEDADAAGDADADGGDAAAAEGDDSDDDDSDDEDEEPLVVELTPAELDTANRYVVLSDPDAVFGYSLDPARMTGEFVDDAAATFQNEWVVNLSFTSEGAVLFDQIAEEFFERQIAIVLDGQVESAPVLNATEYGGTAVISGSFTSEEAEDLALVLRFGALPVEFVQDDVRTVSATLGEGTLRAGIIAGIIGLMLVAVYMLAYYRLLGMVAVGSLLVSGAVLWSLISWLGESSGLALTLAGITGIIVSIGVQVDSNIVYYERIKEEVRRGRAVRSAADASFKAAFATIVWADLASLIGAGVLYQLTSGTVRGFALYLGIATLIDLAVSYFFMQPLVVLVARKLVGEHPERLGMPSMAAATSQSATATQATPTQADTTTQTDTDPGRAQP